VFYLHFFLFPAARPQFKEDLDDEPESPCTVPDGCWKRFIWVLGLPLSLTLYVTVPDCRRERFKKCFVLTFILSVVWIGLFSYLMVWMITVVGKDAMSRVFCPD
jgi:hypothetical protein